MFFSFLFVPKIKRGCCNGGSRPGGGGGLAGCSCTLFLSRTTSAAHCLPRGGQLCSVDMGGCCLQPRKLVGNYSRLGEKQHKRCRNNRKGGTWTTLFKNSK